MRSVNPNQQFLSDFLICHLHNLLVRELGCGSFEADGVINWFHKECRYYSPQFSQFDFNQYARNEVIRHVGPHRLKKDEPPKVVRDQPVATWTPCHHWGGSRVCANCHRASHVAGVMARAQQLWEENHKFVRFYVQTVLDRRGQQVTPDVFDDLVSGVWHYVAKVIDSFKDPGNGTQRRQWLKKAADWTVSDYFRDTMRARRDSRRTDSFDTLAEAS
jgi:hypothetical protein